MLWNDIETQRVIKAVRDGAIAWTKDELTTILKHARAGKDAVFDDTSRKVEWRYRGRQRAAIEAALKLEFPNSNNMPIAAINWTKLVARLDAGVYVAPPDRFLEDKNGKRIPKDDPRAKLWEWALRKSRLHVKMQEVERRALIPPGSVPGRMVWAKPPGDKVGFPRIDIYWPHNVEVICHPEAPTQWEFAYVVTIQIAKPSSSAKGDWFLIWSRVPPDDIEGEWGPWTYVVASTEGEQLGKSAAPVKYDGERLPVFLVQLSDPAGHPFILEDVDLIDVVDDLNKRRSNESFVIGLQGHNQTWTDDVAETATKAVGPDKMMTVSPGRTVNVLQFNAALGDMRESRKLATRELAISRGNSPDAYATEPGPPLSGTAKRIANQAHDTRVAEQAQVMQVIEEDSVLVILLDVMIAFHPDGHILKEVTPRTVPRRPPTVEDPNQKQERLERAATRKWITEARAAVDAEHYPDLETALAEMALIEEAAEADGEGEGEEGEGADVRPPADGQETPISGSDTLDNEKVI